MKLLVAADGSGQVRDAALPAVSKLVGDLDVEVYVLHVVHAASEAWSDEELKQVIAERTHDLEALLVDSEIATKLLVETLPYGGKVDHYICLRAGDLEVDAVVVTSGRATGMVAGLLGSIAQGVLSDSPAPVLVVRPSEGDGAGDEDDPPSEEG
jgi:nucleotide-binding universal stress UspA family protein